MSHERYGLLYTFMCSVGMPGVGGTKYLARAKRSFNYFEVNVRTKDGRSSEWKDTLTDVESSQL